MRLTLKLAVTLTAALAAAPAPARAAADQTLGMALMSAIVNVSGNLVGGAGAVSAQRIGEGRYKITFNRPAALCTFVASVGDPNFFFNGYAVTAGPNSVFDGPTVLHVQTREASGTLDDLPFYVIAFCAG